MLSYKADTDQNYSKDTESLFLQAQMMTCFARWAYNKVQQNLESYFSSKVMSRDHWQDGRDHWQDAEIIGKIAGIIGKIL